VRAKKYRQVLECVNDKSSDGVYCDCPVITVPFWRGGPVWSRVKLEASPRGWTSPYAERLRELGVKWLEFDGSVLVEGDEDFEGF